MALWQLTVMYDAEKIGKLQLRNLKGNNDYALWLQESYCRMSYDDKKYVVWGGEVDEIR